MYNSSLKLLQQIESAGFKAYIVGGYARDLYLNRKSADVDICTNATPKDLKEIFKDSMLPKEQYGSVTVIKNKIHFEITTFRKDIKYKNNRLPVKIKYIDDLLEDLKRRDFVINTLCINSEGNVIDLLNAKQDLDCEVIRTVGNAKNKIKEDSLRILRAIRFATILNFRLDDELKKSIKKYASLLKKLSYHRKKEEIDKIFSSINVKYGIELMLELGVDKYLELSNLKDVIITSNSIGIWAQLNVLDKYEFTNNERELIAKINELCKNYSFDNYVLYKNGLYVATMAAEINKIDKKIITKKYMSLPIKNIKEIMINGNEICETLDIKPSKVIRDIQADLENKIIYGKVVNEKSTIIEYLKENYRNKEVE